MAKQDVGGFAGFKSFDDYFTTQLKPEKSTATLPQQLATPVKIPKSRWETLSWWEKPLDILMRPGYAAVGAVTGIIKGEDPIKRALKGLAGEEPYTFTQEIFKDSPWYIKYPLGIGLDIISDPITFVTAGGVKAMSMASKGLSKAVPPVIRLSDEGTKQYRHIESALATRQGLKQATPEIAESAKDVMRYITERPMMERAKDGPGLIRFDREVGAYVPENVRRLREAGVIAEAPDYMKFLEKPGLRWSVPGIRNIIGEPVVLPGKAAAAAAELPAKAVSAVVSGAKKIPGVGTVARMGESAFESAREGLRGWFKQRLEYAAADDQLFRSKTELAKEMERIAQDTVKRRDAAKSAIEKMGGDVDKFNKNYRDGMTKIFEEIKVLPDTEAIGKYQKKMADLSTNLERLANASKRKELSLQERLAALDKMSDNLWNIESTDPFGIAAKLGLKDVRLGRKVKEEVERRAKKLARADLARDRAIYRDQIKSTVDIISNLGLYKIHLGKRPTRGERALYRALPPEFRSKDPLALKPEEVAHALHFEAGMKDVMTGEEGLQRLVELSRARQTSYWPKRLRKAIPTSDDQIQAAQDMIQEQIIKRKKPWEEIAKRHGEETATTKERLEMAVLELQDQMKNATKTVTTGRGLSGEELRTGIIQSDAGPRAIPELQEMTQGQRDFMAGDREMYEALLAKRQSLDMPTMKREGYLPLQMTPLTKDIWLNAFDELGILGRVQRISGAGMHGRTRMTDYVIDQGAFFDWYNENRIKRGDEFFAALKKHGLSEADVRDVKIWIDDPIQLLHEYQISTTKVLGRQKLRDILLKKFSTHVLDSDDPGFFKTANRILAEEKNSTLIATVRHAPHMEIDVIKLHGATPGQSLQDLVKIKDRIVDKSVWVVPTEIADSVEKLYSITKSDDAWAETFRVFDELQGLWKGSVTVMFPSFHARNVAGGGVMAFFGGIPLAEISKRFYNAFWAFKAWNKGTPGKLGQIVRSPTGVEYAMEDVLKEMDKRGLLRTMLDQELEDINRAMAGSDKASIRGLDKVFRAGQKANEFIDNSGKIALFVHQIERGADFGAATQKVRLSMYGPQRLTDFEKSTASRLIPFYSWIRFSLPLAFRSVAENPGKIAIIGKVINAAENEREAMDKSIVPEWIVRSGGIEVKKEGKTHYFFVMENWLPTADLLKLGDAPRAFLSALTPAIRVPIEMVTNVNAMDMNQLEKFPGETKRFLNVPMRSKAVQLLRNIRILNEVDRLIKPELSVKEKLMSSLAGIRLYPVDEEFAVKAALYKEQRKGSAIKQAMNRTEIQLGPEHDEIFRLAGELAKSKAEQAELRQRALEINPNTFKRELAGAKR